MSTHTTGPGRRAVWAMGLLCNPAAAVDIDLLYRPAEQHSAVQILSPKLGVCQDIACLANEGSVLLELSYESATHQASDDREQRFNIAKPNRTEVVLYPDQSGPAVAATLHWQYLGGQIGSGPGFTLAQNPAMHTDISGGCTYAFSKPLYDNTARFVWRYALGGGFSGRCYSGEGPDANGESFDVTAVSAGYTVSLQPAPSRLRTGIYRGSFVWDVDSNLPGGGTLLSLDPTARHITPSLLRFNVSLRVEHAFRFRFDPEVERIHIRPYSDSDYRTVERDVPFRLTLSGPLSISLACSLPASTGDDCAIGDAQRRAIIPVPVHLWLPAGVVDRHSLIPVEGTHLGPRGAVQVMAENLVNERAGKVRFTVTRAAWQEIAQAAPGKQLAGLFTFNFDAGL